MNNKQVSIFFRTFAPMNKIMTYLYLVILTATGITMAACSDDNDVTTPEEKKTFTLTVEATNGCSDLTRALAEESNALTATWAADDVVKVYNSSDKEIGMLTPQSTGNATTKLSGVLNSAPSDGETLTLKYQETDYSGQDGTLATIGAHHNYCTATTTVTKNGDNYSGTATTFASQQAIVKFTLKKKSDNSVIKATTMNIYHANDAPILSLTLTANNDGIYYIALPPINNEVLRIEVNDGTPYAIESPTTTFEAGKYYCRNVSFTYNEIKVFNGDTGYTIATGSHALCKGTGSGTQLILNDRSTATLDGLELQSPGDACGIGCEGDAIIILKDGTTNSIEGAVLQALVVASGKTLTIPGTGTGTLTLTGYKTTETSYKAVSGKVKIDGNEVDGDKADGTYPYTNLKLVVSDNGNKWVISKKN